jgi:hypothetical protein
MLKVQSLIDWSKEAECDDVFVHEGVAGLDLKYWHAFMVVFCSDKFYRYDNQNQPVASVQELSGGGWLKVCNLGVGKEKVFESCRKLFWRFNVLEGELASLTNSGHTSSQCLAQVKDIFSRLCGGEMKSDEVVSTLCRLVHFCLIKINEMQTDSDPERWDDELERAIKMSDDLLKSTGCRGPIIPSEEEFAPPPGCTGSVDQWTGGDKVKDQ